MLKLVPPRRPGLFEQQKAERRARILAAARRLIAARGYDGLTMRELAEASRVSVPTLYNLFGGKHAILLGELHETLAAVVAAIGGARGRSFVARASAACDAGTRELLKTPRYWRELVQLFLVSEETRVIRRDNEAQYVTLMAGLLVDAQRAGDVVPWADPVAVARCMFAQYLQTMIQWAKGDLDDAGLRAMTALGAGLVLLGVARGRAREQLERRVRAAQRQLAPARRSPRRRQEGER